MDDLYTKPGDQSGLYQNDDDTRWLTMIGQAREYTAMQQNAASQVRSALLRNLNTATDDDGITARRMAVKQAVRNACGWKTQQLGETITHAAGFAVRIRIIKTYLRVDLYDEQRGTHYYEVE